MQTRRNFAAIAAAGALAVLAGCVSLPSPEVMQAETASFALPKQPDPGKALIYVVRGSGPGALIRFNVFMDDQADASEMGFTKGSQYIYFHVAPGEHKIYSKAENWAEMQISAKAGEIIFIRQEPTMGFIMAQNSISKIDEVTGKYYVKNNQLGTIIKADK